MQDIDAILRGAGVGVILAFGVIGFQLAHRRFVARPLRVLRARRRRKVR